ncbi:hypothetical protein PIROE2DRAFT_6010 [Piromyces sp. E2]|nr:hypothetical protein PIROE2DRAFT_6010 [Piromyces sp. E2]|eukprot:OUM66697.1 hypothetical protein PIROE2DRAFT_6010 [Piromyces sp. E2]
MSIIFSIIILCYVCGVLSVTTFFDNGKRANIFELTDNEVGVFKINIPENEFSLLKERAVLIDYAMGEFKNDVQKCYSAIKQFVEIIKYTNFTQTFGEDISKKLTSLKIKEDGTPSYEIDEILAGYNFDKEHYKTKKDKFFNDVLLQVIHSNKDFNLLEILTTLSSVNVTDATGTDPFLVYMLQELSENSSEEDNIKNLELNLNTYISEFKTKNATMTFTINGEEKMFKKVTFSLAGKLSRFFSKPGFNIKIRGGNNLYGLTNLKLRSDCVEPSFLRTKLISDMHNRLGLTSVSANYVTLYINNEYMGLYILSDSYKLPWIESVFGEKEATNLYKCIKTDTDLSLNSKDGCVNENENVTNHTEWINFLKTLDKANTIADLEDIVDVDHFLKEMALEYLLDSWDHIQNGHNYYMFKPQNGKWLYLTHDYDLDFGQDYNDPKDSYIAGEVGIHIIDVLMSSNITRFDKILVDIVTDVFNPNVLYPRIDELKEFIRPYVELEKKPDANGNYPGRINTAANDFFTYDEWDSNVEFTSIKTYNSKAFGLKYWILGMYRFVCKHYDIECDPVYLDENYKYPINKEVEYIDDFEDYYGEYPTDTISDSIFIEAQTTEPFNDEITSSSSDFIDEEMITTEIGDINDSPISSIIDNDVTGVIDDSNDSDKEVEVDVTDVPDDKNDSDMEVEVNVTDVTDDKNDSDIEVEVDVTDVTEDKNDSDIEYDVDVDISSVIEVEDSENEN